MRKQSSWQTRLAAYMVSQGISLLGSSIVSYAVMWYVTLKTGSGSMAAWVTITTFAPQALVMLYGGVLADRYPPKRIIIMSDSSIALSTLVLSVLFACGNESITLVLAFNALRSLGTGLQLPATKNILPLMVPEEQLMRANGMSTGMWSLTQLVSPALGGLAMTYMSMQNVFLIDVATAAVSISIFAAIAIPQRALAITGENTKEGLIRGFRYILGSKTLRSCLILYTVFQFLMIPASSLTPLLATINVGSEVLVLSTTETAFSVGALAASALMACLKIKMPHLKLVGLSSAVFGATMMLLLPMKSIVTFSLVMLVMGIGSPLYYTPLVTFIQENTQEEYMGRTFSYMDMFAAVATPLGMAVFGPLANVSLSASFILPGVSLILLGIYAIRKL